MDDGLMATILHGRFSPDSRGLISELVRRLMEHRSLTATRLAQIVEDRLGRAGPAPDVFDLWRAGQGGAPPGDVLIELLKLAREDPDLASLVDALIGHRTELNELSSSRSRNYATLTNVERRRFFQILMGSAVGGSLPFDSQHVEFVRQGLDAAITGDSALPVVVADWEETALAHGRASRDRPSPLMLTDLIHDLNELQRVVESNRSSDGLNDLTRVAAQMSGLMVLTLVKLNDKGAFRYWARTARVAAARAGDPLVHSWVRAQEAYGYYYAGDLLRAVEVAQDAQRLAGPTACVGSVLAAALEARAHAALGRPAETISAVQNAEDALLHLDPRFLVPSAFGYTEAQLRFHESNALTQLGDAKRAWVAQERALALTPKYDYTDRTLTHLDRATCMVHSRDVSGAVAYAAQALEALTVAQRRGIITVRAKELVAMLPATVHHLPAIRNLRELVMSSEGDA